MHQQTYLVHFCNQDNKHVPRHQAPVDWIANAIKPQKGGGKKKG